MTEEQQLAILERIPGFIRPSAEWLKSLEVGDRVMLYIMKDNGFVEWGPSIVEDKYLHSFELRYLDALYPVNRSGNLTEGGGQDRIWTYWIGPIEPEPPQQDKPTATEFEGAVQQLSERLFHQEHKADRLTKDLNKIAARLGIPPDDQMMGEIGRTLDQLLDIARKLERSYAIKQAIGRTQALVKVADQIGISGADEIGANDLEAAIGRRLSELLETEELYQAPLPVPYGDRS